jgi:hypothetical protein
MAAQILDYLIAVMQKIELLIATLGQNRKQHLLLAWPVALRILRQRN